jgi:hypothetical protein
LRTPGRASTRAVEEAEVTKAVGVAEVIEAGAEAEAAAGVGGMREVPTATTHTE